MEEETNGRKSDIRMNNFTVLCYMFSLPLLFYFIFLKKREKIGRKMGQVADSHCFVKTNFAPYIKKFPKKIMVFKSVIEHLVGDSC
jgi:hypothetical protein